MKKVDNDAGKQEEQEKRMKEHMRDFPKKMETVQTRAKMVDTGIARLSLATIERSLEEDKKEKEPDLKEDISFQDYVGKNMWVKRP